MARTAFEDALDTGELPSYYTAADTLSTANRNPTFVHSALNTIRDVQRFIGVSIISGANEIYNMPANIGNIFGADIETSKTEDLVAAIDSDLEQFYKDHKTGADLVGFLASSILPGTAGVKVLNAGQRALKGAFGSGKYGKNMGQALGLMTGTRKQRLAAAVEEVANGTAPASLLNGNALRSMGAGLGQNVLEATAAEIAVATTMHSSPILENQDFGDFVTNIAVGGAVFGAFAGVVDVAKTSAALKKASRDWDDASRPFSFIEESASISTPSESISLDIEQLKNLPEVLAQGNDPTLVGSLNSARKATVRKLENRIRRQVSEIANGDNEVAGIFHASLRNTSFENQQYNYIDLEDLSRLGQKTKATDDIEAMARKINEGDVDIDSPEMQQFLNDEKYVSYIRMWGDDAGQAYETVPPTRTMLDNLGKDGKIEIKKYQVKIGDQQTIRFSQANNIGKKASDETAKVGDITNLTPLEVEARYAWSRSEELESFAKILDDPGAKIVIHGNDIPMLEKLVREVPDALSNPNVKIVVPEGTVVGPEHVSLNDFIMHQKVALANKFLDKNDELVANFQESLTLDQEQIAKLVNVRTRFLSGETRKFNDGVWAEEDMFALDTYTKELAERLGVEVKNGKIQVGPSKEGGKHIWEMPQTVRAIYDGARKEADAAADEISNFVTENMVTIREHQRIYQDDLNRAAAMTLGQRVMDALPEITTPRVRAGAVSTGAGAGRFTAASSNYGSLAALVEYVGSVTSRAIGDAKTLARTELEGPLYDLGQNQAAAIEWATLNANLRNIPAEYVLDETGDKLIPAVVKRYNEQVQDAIATGSKGPDMYQLPDPEMPLEIPIQHDEVKRMVEAHIAVNGRRTEGLSAIRAAQGVNLSRSADAFYPIPVNPKDYKHFGMVRDRSATGHGSSRTLFATSAEELKQMKIKIEQNNPQLEVLTKADAEDYHKAIGDWDYEKTLNSVYLNAEAKRAGTSAPFIVSTDPSKIVDDALSWHLQRETGMIREAVSAKYEVQFEELRRLGDEATNIETSKFSDQSLLTYAEESVKNPFSSYIKTALAVRDNASYPIWTSVNRYADEVISSVMKRVHDSFYTMKGDTDVEAINQMLKQAGYKGVAYDEQMNIFANATPARGTLSAIVQKANSTLATIVLRWDFLNAINNAVSANVLLGAEMKAVQRALSTGGPEAADALGELNKLTRIAVPGAEGRTMAAPTKLIAKAFEDFHKEGRNGPTMQFFRDNGYMTSITDQYRDAIDTLSYSGRESVDRWNSRIDGLRKKMRDAGDKGEQWTGNRLAEEFNRFIAAHVMKQITDPGVKRGLISAKEQLAYINTFVNRTQGNYLASQRPMAFQGPIGQAIGLFQTYQFNLFQQLFRHIGEGTSKDALTLLGLQGTIHGMNGLPAFNAVNTHIVGTASGNTSHRDAYDTTYGIVGKEAGDFLMYGAASSAMGLGIVFPELKVNLYSRGDLNPRHITLLPTDPGSVPFIQAWGKFAGNLVNTGKEMNAGGDFAGTMLRGMEHNGISRPLAGLARTLNAFNNPNSASFSTSSRGNVVAANDLMSLSNLSRIAGGKPLDEAIALDATYRFRTYGLKDSRKRQLLGRAIKSTVIAGKNPTPQQIEEFAQNYAALGGRQEEFAQWFTSLYKEANSSQANEILRSLNSPFTQAMQEIMGGEPVQDFSGN